MATLIGDYGETSRFHSSGLQYQHSHDPHAHPQAYASVSRSRDVAPSPRAQRRQPSASPRHQHSSSSSSSTSSSALSPSSRTPAAPAEARDTTASPAETRPAESARPPPPDSAASCLFTPPSSTSPSAASSNTPADSYARGQRHSPADMQASARPSSAPSHMIQDPLPSDSVSSAAQPTTIPTNPSPETTQWTAPRSSSRTTHAQPPSPGQTTIRVRDLAHIQSLARADLMTGNGPGILNDPPLQAMRYEISGMPIGDIIEMVAALLTKITTTNDLQHDALNRNSLHIKQAQAQAAAANSSSGAEGGTADGQPQLSPMSSSVLAFHGKNVPAITILSYLSRIHKYCPTTYEVFLSLLVYFDRMTERVNEIVMKSEDARRLSQVTRPKPDVGPAATTTDAEAEPQEREDAVMHDEDDSDDSDGLDSDLADEDDDDDEEADDDDGDRMDEDRQKRKRAASDPKPSSDAQSSTPSSAAPLVAAADNGSSPQATAEAAVLSQATYFVVDSFNIHRLVIAGVTCASKFFSDVFYTNSRYAKVGGLPLAELNHLELQFLLLNDFRLAVPVEDLEAYATMLVEFYAREVVAQRSRPVVGMD